MPSSSDEHVWQERVELREAALEILPVVTPLLNTMVVEPLEPLPRDATDDDRAAQQTWDAVLRFDADGRPVTLPMRNPIVTTACALSVDVNAPYHFWTAPVNEEERRRLRKRVINEALFSLKAIEERWLLERRANETDGRTWDGLIAQIEYGAQASLGETHACYNLDDQPRQPDQLLDAMETWFWEAHAATGATPDTLVCHPARWHDLRYAMERAYGKYKPNPHPLDQASADSVYYRSRHLPLTLRMVVDPFCPEDALLALSTRWPAGLDGALDGAYERLRRLGLPGFTMAYRPTADYFALETHSDAGVRIYGLYRTGTFRIYWLGGQLLMRGVAPLATP